MSNTTKQATRWAIIGYWGLYTGQWHRKCDAIIAHTTEIGRNWKWCRRQGDKAVKVRITWTEPK